MSSYIIIDSNTIRNYCYDCLDEIHKRRKEIVENGIERAFKQSQQSKFPWRRRKTKQDITVDKIYNSTHPTMY